MFEWVLEYGDRIGQVLLGICLIGALAHRFWERRRTARALLAKAHARLGADTLRHEAELHDGAAATIAGTLVAGQTRVRRVDDGRDAAVISVWEARPRHARSRVEARHLATRGADPLALRVGDRAVTLRGPIELLLGSRTCQWARTPQALPRPIGGRIEALVGAGTMDWPVRVHTLDDGDPIRARGALRAVASPRGEAAGYREAAIEWELHARDPSETEPSRAEPILIASDAVPTTAVPGKLWASFWALTAGLALGAVALALVGSSALAVSRRAAPRSLLRAPALVSPWARGEALADIAARAVEDGPGEADLDLAERAALESDRERALALVGAAMARRARFDRASRLFGAWWRVRVPHAMVRGFLMRRDELASHLFAGRRDRAFEIVEDVPAARDSCLAVALQAQRDSRAKAATLLRSLAEERGAADCAVLGAALRREPAARLDILRTVQPERGRVAALHGLLRFEALWNTGDERSAANRAARRDAARRVTEALESVRPTPPVERVGVDLGPALLAPAEMTRVLGLLGAPDPSEATELLDLRAHLQYHLALFDLATAEVASARRRAEAAEDSWLAATLRLQGFERAAREEGRAIDGDAARDQAERFARDALRASRLRVAVELRAGDLEAAGDLLRHVQGDEDAARTLLAWLHLLSGRAVADEAMARTLLDDAVEDLSGSPNAGALVHALTRHGALPSTGHPEALRPIELVLLRPRLDHAVYASLARETLEAMPLPGPGRGPSAALGTLCERLAVSSPLGAGAGPAIEAREALRRWRAALLDDELSPLWQVHFALR